MRGGPDPEDDWSKTTIGAADIAKAERKSAARNRALIEAGERSASIGPLSTDEDGHRARRVAPSPDSAAVTSEASGISGYGSARGASRRPPPLGQHQLAARIRRAPRILAVAKVRLRSQTYGLCALVSGVTSAGKAVIPQHTLSGRGRCHGVCLDEAACGRLS